MALKQIKKDKLHYVFSLELEAKALEETLEQETKKLQKKAKIAGFRPGKAPLEVVRRLHGERLMEDARIEQIQQAVQSLRAEKKLDILGQPSIKPVEGDKKNLSFNIEFDVIPPLEGIDLKKIQIERPVLEVSSEKEAEMLKDIAKNYRKSEKVQEDRPAVEGDIVCIDFVGKIDGALFEGGKGEDHDLELGSGAFIAGFEDQLVGVRAGEQREIKVSFPEQYRAEKLAGKEVVFDVRVHALKAYTQAAAPDDDMAKQMGFKDLQGLNEYVRLQLRQRMDQDIRYVLKRRLFDILEKQNKADLPQGLLDSEAARLFANFLHTKKDHPERLSDKEKNQTDEEIREDLRKIAARQVLLGFVLSKIGTENNIELTQEEVNRAILAEAYRFRGQEQKVIDYFRKNPAAVEDIKAPVLQEKIVDFILEHITLVDKPFDEEALADLLRTLEP